MNVFMVIATLAMVIFLVFFLVLKSRNMHIWIVSYIFQKIKNINSNAVPHKHIYFCFVDHYEPFWRTDSDTVASHRVAEWKEKYPPLAKKHIDSDGNHPVHTFFYPEEEYRKEYLQVLSEFKEQGIGDVEIHLHHDNDNAENLAGTLNRFKTCLHEKHSLLRRDPITNEIIYAFIHGNWALDNSRPDGRYCGIDNELSVLVKTGCYADLTMPSAPSDTQTRKINSIYCARGKHGHSKGHNSGTDVSTTKWPSKDELLCIQGPLTLNWASRKFGVIPRIESSEISHDAPPSGHRITLWEKSGIHVKGRPDHIFIKVHTHGTVEPTMKMLFDNGFERLWTELEKNFRDNPGYSLHYVSCWDMYNRIYQLAHPKS